MSEISELQELRRRNQELHRQVADLTTPRTSAEVNALDAIQRRADSIAAKFGERAPAPQLGERPDAYRRRVLEGLQRHSPTFADFDVARADEALLAVAEREIYEAAEEAARSGLEAKQPLVRVDELSGGRTVTTYYGDNLEWMRPFMSGGQVCRIVRPGLAK